ncbi:MAG TPA: GtrA family protein, partial [Candidatus Berkiella sp.]|nr:GtrA family protein [Candidatus Berkiella sp.]
YRYIIAGGACAILDISLFMLLSQHFAYHYLILATFSFIIATLANFVLCNQFVFKHQQSHSSQMRFMLTYLVSGIGLSIHHLCLFLAFEWFALNLIISKLFAMGTAFGWNFLSRKYLVFKAASPA